jgi:hypothetical protein
VPRLSRGPPVRSRGLRLAPGQGLQFSLGGEGMELKIRRISRTYRVARSPMVLWTVVGDGQFGTSVVNGRLSLPAHWAWSTRLGWGRAVCLRSAY